jgi:hypothetical protein
MLRIILIVLTVLFSTSAYGETYIDGVVGSILNPMRTGHAKGVEVKLSA